MSLLNRWGSFARSPRNSSVLYAQFEGRLSNNRTEPSRQLPCAIASAGLAQSDILRAAKQHPSPKAGGAAPFLGVRGSSGGQAADLIGGGLRQPANG